MTGTFYFYHRLGDSKSSKFIGFLSASDVYGVSPISNESADLELIHTLHGTNSCGGYENERDIAITLYQITGINNSILKIFERIFVELLDKPSHLPYHKPIKQFRLHQPHDAFKAVSANISHTHITLAETD